MKMMTAKIHEKRARFTGSAKKSWWKKSTSFFDVRDKIRTRDLLVRSQTLYPAELHVRMEYSIIITTAVVINAGDRGRTGTGV